MEVGVFWHRDKSLPCKALIDATVDGQQPQLSPASTTEANAEALQLYPGNQTHPDLGRPWALGLLTLPTLQSNRQYSPLKTN
jgi:hypothetical protein